MAEYKDRLLRRAKKEQKPIEIGDSVLVPRIYFDKWSKADEKVEVTVVEKFDGKIVVVGTYNVHLVWKTISETEAIKKDFSDVGYNPFEGQRMWVREYYYSIGDLVDLNYIDLDRAAKWDDIKKSMFLGSIYRGLPVGSFLLKEIEDSTDLFEIIDGKERLKTLLDFVQDKIPDGNGLYFSDFSEHAKKKFMNMEDILSVFVLDKNIEDFNIERLKALWK